MAQWYYSRLSSHCRRFDPEAPINFSKFFCFRLLQECFEPLISNLASVLVINVNFQSKIDELHCTYSLDPKTAQIVTRGPFQKSAHRREGQIWAVSTPGVEELTRLTESHFRHPDPFSLLECIQSSAISSRTLRATLKPSRLP